MNRSIQSSLKHLLYVALAAGLVVTAQDTESTVEDVDEVVLVTAQRVAEDIQDVPIAVTALSGDMIEEQQVITPSDLQINTPSLSYTSTNFGGSALTIRGVGQLIIAGSGEPGVSTHINEIPVRSNLNQIEFFDLERVEILRGPQGTLFGRNATGGAINFVTAKPKPGETSGSIDYELGAYNHSRLKGYGNLSLGDKFAIRFAGYQLSRDGYTENEAYGQVGRDGYTLENISDSFDGRDMSAFRTTIGYTGDTIDAWLMFASFDEDSDRARITNQVCAKNPLPTTGCLPDGVGFDSPHVSATTGGFFGGAVGAFPLGFDGSEASITDFPRPNNLGLRTVHTDFQPVYVANEDFVSWGINAALGQFSVHLNGLSAENFRIARQDYIQEVGNLLGATPQNPTGVWPTTEPTFDASSNWVNGNCNLLGGTAGAIGGCIHPDLPTNRITSYDQSDTEGEYETWEARVASNFDGGFNFMLGMNSFEQTSWGSYFVLSNTLDIVSVFGAPSFGLPPLYPGFFGNIGRPEMPGGAEGTSTFGEVYFEPNSDLTFTIGLRNNEDERFSSGTSVLFNSINQHAILLATYQALIQQTAAALGVPPEVLTLEQVLPGAYALGLLHPDHQFNTGFGTGTPFWSRTLNLLLGPLGGEPELDLVRLYGATDAQIQAALQTAGYSPERIALSQLVPIVPEINESRLRTGSPEQASFSETTGRIGVDWQYDNNTLIYAFHSRGYKPGGLNSALSSSFLRDKQTYRPEEVTAFEIGFKTRRNGGKLMLNGAAFAYDYTGMQSTRIRLNSALTDNIDSNINGIELEGTYRFNENFGIDFSYSGLNATVDGSTSLDPINRTGGDSSWVLLNNIDPGALTAINYIARADQLTADVINTALAANTAADIRNGLTAVSVSYPANNNGVSIPVFISRSYLDAIGVETSDGIEVDLDGNDLPASPPHSLRFGAVYTQPTSFGSGTIDYRLDYYWQSESYAREFNTVGDEIEAWGQVNASMTYRNSSDSFMASLWVRNLADSENVTGHYLTSDTSGFFRNYFLTEPRIAGLTLRVSFGD